MVGLLFARFTAPDYVHASLTLQEGGDIEPLYISHGEGKRTLALSIKNLQDEADVRITVDGGRITSSQPPPIALPFRQWLSSKDNVFSGLKRGMKFPLSLVLDGQKEDYELLFVRAADNSVIQRVPIIRGGSRAHH